MSEIDYSLHNLPILLAANKSESYQMRVLEISNSLVNFLHKNSLLIGIDPFDADGKVKKNIVIRMSNVTVDGLELFRKTVPGWLSFVDKGGDVKNISRLEKGLAKLNG